MFANIVVKRSQQVEAQFTGTPATGKKYQFTDIPNLARNNILVYGFEAFTATQLSISSNGNTVVPAADVDNITITLRDNNKEEFIYQMPLYSCVRSLNGGLSIISKPRIINLTDCYAQLTAVGSVTANMVLVLNLYYDIVK